MSLAHPFGARAVAVLPFVELPPVGVGDELAARLADALCAGGAVVVTDLADADALLEGELRVINRPGTTLQAVQVYHVDGALEARWHDAAGTVIWRGQAAATESYLPQGVPGVRQPAATETQRRMALQRLAGRLAEQLERAMDAAQLPAAPPAAPAAPPPAEGPPPHLP